MDAASVPVQVDGAISSVSSHPGRRGHGEARFQNPPNRFGGRAHATPNVCVRVVTEAGEQILTHIGTVIWQSRRSCRCAHHIPIRA